MLSGTCLITGGAGFLGRGLMRRAALEGWPCKFVVYSRDEQKHLRAKRKYPDARYVVGDILDTQRLALVMSGCDYAVHAAALKHIPVGEHQPSEVIRVNIDGTRCVFDAACEAGVKRVVLISTDKCVEAVNAYGASKMLCERLVFESVHLEHPSGAKFVACRYGNLVGSTGSVWQVFKQQREQDGRLSVTNPSMTRFYWGIDEAVELIDYAINKGTPGTVLMPTLGAVTLDELASHISRIWDLPLYNVIGARPGEKLHEQIVGLNEINRLVRVLGTDYWVLYGPTKRVTEPNDRPLMSFGSDLASDLGVERFVQLAEDSESV